MKTSVLLLSSYFYANFHFYRRYILYPIYKHTRFLHTPFMDIFAFDAASFLSFLLTFMRVSLVVFLLPFWGGDSIPQLVKGAFCLILTISIWPHLSLPGAGLPSHPIGIILVIVNELLLGLTLGLVVHFIFAGIQTGGEILASQMGFTMATLADPSTSVNASAISFLLYTLSMVVFLLLDGHLHLFRALSESFHLIPPGGLVISEKLNTDILHLSAELFVLALKIAAPAMGALFVAELTLALMGNAAPQMNIMTLGFPIKIGVGFFLLSILFEVMSTRMEKLIYDLGPQFIYLMSVAK